MHKIALFFPKTAAFHGLRFETKKATALKIRKSYNNEFFDFSAKFRFFIFRMVT